MLSQQVDSPSLATDDQINCTRVGLAATLHHLKEPHQEAGPAPREDQTSRLLQTSSSSPPSSLNQAGSTPQHFTDWLGPLKPSSAQHSTELRESASISQPPAQTDGFARESPSIKSAGLRTKKSAAGQNLPPTEKEKLLLTSVSAPVKLTDKADSISVVQHKQNGLYSAFTSPQYAQDAARGTAQPSSKQIEQQNSAPVKFRAQDSAISNTRWAPMEAPTLGTMADHGPFSAAAAGKAAKVAVGLGPFGSAASSAMAAMAAAALGEGGVDTACAGSGKALSLESCMSLSPERQQSAFALKPSQALALADSAELTRSLRGLQMQSSGEPSGSLHMSASAELANQPGTLLSSPTAGINLIAHIAHLEKELAVLKSHIPAFAHSVPNLQERLSAPAPANVTELQQQPGLEMERTAREGPLQARRSCPPAMTELQAAFLAYKERTPGSEGEHQPLAAVQADPRAWMAAADDDMQASEPVFLHGQHTSSPPTRPRHKSTSPAPRPQSRGNPHRAAGAHQVSPHQQLSSSPPALQHRHSAPAHAMQQAAAEEGGHGPRILLAQPLYTGPAGGPQQWAGSMPAEHHQPCSGAERLLIVQDAPSTLQFSHSGPGASLQWWPRGASSPRGQPQGQAEEGAGMETDQVYVPVHGPQPRLEDAVDLLPKQTKRTGHVEQQAGAQSKRRRSLVLSSQDMREQKAGTQVVAHQPAAKTAADEDVVYVGEVVNSSPFHLNAVPHGFWNKSPDHASRASPSSPQVLLHIEAPAHWERHDPAKEDAVKLVRLELPGGHYFAPDQLLEAVPNEALQEVAAQAGGVVGLNDAVAALRMCDMQPVPALALLEACLNQGHMAQQLWDERVRSELPVRQVVVNQEVEMILGNCESGGMPRDRVHAIIRVQNACMMAAYQLQCRALKSSSDAPAMQETWMWLGADKNTIHAVTLHGFGQLPNGTDPKVFWSPHARESAEYSVAQDAVAASAAAGAPTRHALLMCCTALTPGTPTNANGMLQMCVAALYPAYIVLFSE